MRSAAKSLLLSLGLLLNLPAAAAAQSYTVVRVDTRSERIELFLRDERGAPYLRFARLAEWLEASHRRLRFAMNAGMYEPDFSPVGLFVADGRQLAPLNLADGKGNFYLKPNGIFLIDEAGPRIVESSKYPAVAKGVRLATQSGPLLVEGGAIHPGFDPDSSSRHLRNGVGVAGHDVYFVISEKPVTFHEMALYFRDVLHCPDALYLDGAISSIWSPERRRNDARADLGPMLGVVDDLPVDGKHKPSKASK